MNNAGKDACATRFRLHERHWLEAGNPLPSVAARLGRARFGCVAYSFGELFRVPPDAVGDSDLLDVLCPTQELLELLARKNKSVVLWIVDFSLHLLYFEDLRSLQHFLLFAFLASLRHI